MTLCRIFLILLCLQYLGALNAEETDQFTLPPQKLADFGPEASQRLYTIIEDVKNQTNAEIQRLLPYEKTSASAALKIEKRQTGDYLAHEIYEKCGPGFPRWLRQSNYSNGLPTRYREILPWKTIYWMVFSQSPLSLIGLTPTVRMYDYYFGTDKMGHFFAQGNTYYQIYKRHLAKNKSVEEAHEAMVRYGQLLEKTYLGVLVNGIYSNADLSANYAGWKFYMNLTEEITIGNQRLPPLLVLHHGIWEFSPHVCRENLFKPYLSDNLNEAWNPSWYAFNRNQICKQVKKRCRDWIEKQGLTREMAGAKLKETSSWHGEEYGHWMPEGEVVSLETCFE